MHVPIPAVLILACLAGLPAAAADGGHGAAVDTKPSAAEPPVHTDHATVFIALEAAFRATDAAASAALWHADGLVANLVGGSGLSGEEAFDQGSRKHWYLKPDATRPATAPADGIAVVPCEIWSWDQQRAVDRVVAVVVRDAAGAWRLLAAGESRVEVDALVQRYLARQPLAP